MSGTNGSGKGLNDAEAYARSSTDKQETSCPEQLAWAARKAKDAGLNLVKSFADHGVPGDRLDRPGLEKLFADLERRQRAGRPVPVLLVFDQDRLSRGTSWAAGAIMERLTRLGVERLVTASRELDLFDDTVRAVFGLEQDLGKRAYVKSLSRNISRAMPRLAEKGCWNGGSPPHGYRVAGAKYDRHLVPGPAEEVEVVRELFRLAAQGTLTPWALARLANERGFAVPAASVLRQEIKRRKAEKPLRERLETATGAARERLEADLAALHEKLAPRWTGYTVGWILRQPVYLGIIRYGRRRKGKYHEATADGPVEKRGLSQPAAPPQVREGCHDALVDRPTFDRVQAVLASRRLDRHAGRRRPHDFAFSGLLTCACCEGVMQGRHKGKFHGYVCSTWRNRRGCSRNGIGESDLLDIVCALLDRELSKPATLARLRKELESLQSGCGAVLRATLEKGRQHVAELEQKVEAGESRLLEVSRDMLPKAENQLRRLLAELEAARAELADVEAQVAAQPPQEDIDAAMARLADLPRLLAEADPEARSGVVQVVVKQISLRFDVHTGPSGRKMSTWTGGSLVLRGNRPSYKITVLTGDDCRAGCPRRRQWRRKRA
jgi:DNA invertase Pin-like site-specific DNA recombinase